MNKKKPFRVCSGCGVKMYSVDEGMMLDGAPLCNQCFMEEYRSLAGSACIGFLHVSREQDVILTKRIEATGGNRNNAFMIDCAKAAAGIPMEPEGTVK